MTTQYYHYDSNGLYTHSSQVQLDPIEGKPMPIALATFDAPPTAGDYQTAKFDRNTKQWSLVTDYRNYKYWTPEDGDAEITAINITPPDNAIAIMNGSEKLIKTENGTWRLRNADDDLNDIKVQKITELVNAFNIEFTAGFESDAFGSTHRYDSQQHNIDWIQGASNSKKDRPITCDDLLGNPDSKQPRIHTKDQALQVKEDGMDALLALKNKFRDLREQSEIAADEAAVNAINW